MKPVNQKAWFLILPVILCVAFSAILPLMTVVNYSVQDIISPERRVFVGTEWLKQVMRDDDLQGALLRQIDKFQASIADDARVKSVVGPGDLYATTTELKKLPEQLKSSKKMLKIGRAHV